MIAVDLAFCCFWSQNQEYFTPLREARNGLSCHNSTTENWRNYPPTHDHFLTSSPKPHFTNNSFISERIIDSDDIHNELWLKPCSDLLWCMTDCHGFYENAWRGSPICTLRWKIIQKLPKYNPLPNKLTHANIGRVKVPLSPRGRQFYFNLISWINSRLLWL